MASKKQRIVGMIAFSAITAFLFWYVNYLTPNNYYSNNLFGYISLQVVGWGTRPFGYNSVAYRIAAKFVSERDGTATNSIWVLTQSIPIFISWGIRKRLGRNAQAAQLALRKLWDAV